MRQVFSSQRLETVEGVARLLNEHDIATRISNGRSYKGSFRRGFSYRDPPGALQPAVWVIHSDDQPRARQLLRDAGLIDSTRPESRGSFVTPQYVQPAPGAAPAGRLFSPARLRMALMVGIGIIIGMTAWWQSRQRPDAAPVRTLRGLPAEAPARPDTPAPDPIYGAPVPTALAKRLFEDVARHRAIEAACLKRDGEAMPTELNGTPKPAACAEGGDYIDAVDYRTDGSGIGTVRAQWRVDGESGSDAYETRRDGHAWTLRRNAP